MSIQGEFVGLLLRFVLVRGTGTWGLEWLYVCFYNTYHA